MIKYNCWKGTLLSWSKINNNKDKKKLTYNNNWMKATNWMSLHKWSHREWMPQWWVTSHKLNKTLFIEFKRIKYMKPDSRTSLLEI